MKALITSLFICSFFLAHVSHAKEPVCADLFKHKMKKLHASEDVDLCELTQGKAVLVVNTASHCGFTGQFKGLESLHKKYRDQGLVLVGFASDDFYQEADSEEETAKVCYVNYGVSFTMLAPTSVRGDDANPVFKGINEKSSKPGWNFTKYLINDQGKVVNRFSSGVKPSSMEMNKAIEQTLKTIEI
jgi:glutathione peroxidase